MELVKQENAYGCGPACFAMILGKSYAEIISDFHNDFESEGMNVEQAIDYLGDKGFSIVHKTIKTYLEKDFARAEMLKPFAPVHLVRIMQKFDSNSGHFVVMTNKGKILCPQETLEKEIRDCYLITDVLGLYKGDL
jgi:hypothetical protein